MQLSLKILGLLLILSIQGIAQIQNHGQYYAAGDEEDISTNLYFGWNLNETTGTVAQDVSVNNNDGTNNGATINQTGKIGQAYSFDGTNDRVYRTNSGHSVFSVSFWHYVPSSSTNSTYDRLMAHTSYAFELARASDGSLRVYDGGWRDTGYDFTTGWHHVALVKYSSIYLIYVDNNLEFSYGSTRTIASTAAIYFGTQSSGSEATDGLLDAIYYYDTAISEAKIALLWATGNGVEL